MIVYIPIFSAWCTDIQKKKKKKKKKKHFSLALRFTRKTTLHKILFYLPFFFFFTYFNVISLSISLFTAFPAVIVPRVLDSQKAIYNMYMQYLVVTCITWCNTRVFSCDMLYIPTVSNFGDLRVETGCHILHQ